MAVTQCPHCSLEVESDDGISGLFDCPHCGKELGGIDEENDDGWFVPWFLLVSFLGVIIFDSLMDPDMFTKDESFWDFLIGFLFIDGSFGYWDFILTVILFILVLLGGAFLAFLEFLPDVESEDGMQFDDAVTHTDIETRDRDEESDEEIEHNILTRLDWAASKIYLQVGILVLLYPVAMFFPPFLPIYLPCLSVPFISWRYRRSRRMWQSSQDLAREILDEFDLN